MTQDTPNKANTNEHMSHMPLNIEVKDDQLTPHYSCTYNTN